MQLPPSPHPIVNSACETMLYLFSEADQMTTISPAQLFQVVSNVSHYSTGSQEYQICLRGSVIPRRSGAYLDMRDSAGQYY